MLGKRLWRQFGVAAERGVKSPRGVRKTPLRADVGETC
jgi:hypothetical protein